MEERNHVWLLQVDTYWGKNDKSNRHSVYVYASYNKVYKAYSKEKQDLEYYLSVKDSCGWEESRREYKKITVPATNYTGNNKFTLQETIYTFNTKAFQECPLLNESHSGYIKFTITKEYIK